MSSADETDATLEFSAMQDEVTPSFIYRHLLHKDANFKKLKTREDPYHIHKTLGILSLCSFFYRYGVQYPATGNLGFSGDWLDWLTMTIHTALALSSILFRVPKKRIPDKVKLRDAPLASETSASLRWFARLFMGSRAA